MNKNKKRHISKAKFERVFTREMEAYGGYNVTSSFTYFDKEIHYLAVASGDFLYWELIRLYGTKEYYRKALSEVFK